MTSWNLLSVEEIDYERSTPPLNDIVPADIWATIFQIFCQRELKERQQVLQGPLKSDFLPRRALRLSHVCRHWHAVATSQPLLWRNIFVCMQTKSPYSLLKLCLPRTGDADLFISIVAYSSDVADIEELKSCLQMLYGVSNRWKSVSFTIGEVARKELESIFCRHSNDPEEGVPDFSSLETIGAMTAKGREAMERDEYGFIARFCDAVKITPPFLRIGGWCNGSTSLPTPKYVKSNSRLQSVVSLTLFRRYLGALKPFFSSLATMSQLKHLEFKDCSCHVPYDKYSDRVTLPHLETLSVLDIAHHGDAESIFQTVLLPELKDVTFTPPLHTPSFREMANLSNCKIRRLCMTANQNFYEYLFYFLAAPAFSELEELTLEAEQIDRQQVQFFDIAPATFDIPKINKQVTTPVFPRTLTSLTLIGCISDDGLLGEVATARMKNGSLQYFYAEVLDEISKNHQKDEKVFRDLRRNGLDAELRQKTVNKTEDIVPLEASGGEDGSTDNSEEPVNSDADDE